jgi:hypothetical protein
MVYSYERRYKSVLRDDSKWARVGRWKGTRSRDHLHADSGQHACLSTQSSREGYGMGLEILAELSGN